MLSLSRKFLTLWLMMLSASAFAQDQLRATPNEIMQFKEAAPARRGPASTVGEPTPRVLESAGREIETVVGDPNQYPFTNYNPEIQDSHTEGTICVACLSNSPMRARPLTEQARQISTAVRAQPK